MGFSTKNYWGVVTILIRQSLSLANNTQHKHTKSKFLNIVNLNIRIYWYKLEIIHKITTQFSLNKVSHSITHN